MTLVAQAGELRGEIKCAATVGWYLLIFKGERCIRDHLQDTLDQAKEQADEDYGIPVDAWREAAR
jgi:hypothetical protein